MDELTPGPWRWKFNSTAGNYFLYGSGGDGPITHSAPDSADGRLKEAAPALLAALTEPLADSPALSFADDLESIARFLNESDHSASANRLRAKAQAIRAAIAAALREPFDGAQDAPQDAARGEAR